jgi:hypothetical protein
VSFDWVGQWSGAEILCRRSLVGFFYFWAPVFVGTVCQIFDAWDSGLRYLYERYAKYLDSGQMCYWRLSRANITESACRGMVVGGNAAIFGGSVEQVLVGLPWDGGLG